MNSRWVKGQSGNPGGRPRMTEDMRDMQERARAVGPEAIDILLSIARDEGAPPSARVSAASSILDRGYGRAPQGLSVNINGPEMSLAEILASMPRSDLEVPCLVGSTSEDSGTAEARLPSTQLQAGPASGCRPGACK